MIQKWDPKRAERFDQFFRIWWDFNKPPLILTDEDQISVGELKRQYNCPVIKNMEKLKLKDTQKVFYKEEGGQWAFSLRKG